MESPHQPVLLEEVLNYLAPSPGETYLDATAGYGGHATQVAKRISPGGQMVLVDQDEQATEFLQQKFQGLAEVIQSDYDQALAQLHTTKKRFDMILFDLGVSSAQLDQPDRGFSFRFDRPLDMRMNQSQKLSAATVVNQYEPSRLEQIIARYGEEPQARRIAAAIVAARPITTTGQLADVIRHAKGYRRGKIDAATRTFQSIRIEVNDELGQLERALPQAVELLKPGGRLVVISFHSLEDRLVKQFFAREAVDCICPPDQPVCTCDHKATIERLTKGAIRNPDDFNPRARSAKLRAVRKLKTKINKEGQHDPSRQKLL